MKFAIRYWWGWIILLSFFTYSSALDNFFVWDDFIWLHRSKTLLSNPVQIFQRDGFYFDPLVYLSFWFDFNLFGTDYRWYHLSDLAIHTTNSLLVFCFVRLYSRNDMAALVSGLIFASTFSGSDAVLWSSARVDLLATLFSLATIILFSQYLKEGRKHFYIATIISYIAALGAKGTPVVLPGLLLWVFIKKEKRHYGIFILWPFVIITAGYLVLLHVTAGSSPLFGEVFNPNFYNYFLAIAFLFIPEMVLAKMNLTYILPVVYGILIIFWLVKFSPQSNRIKSIGLVMIFLFLAPVLVLGKFTVPSMENPTHFLLGALSHRIYIASIGISVFLSSIFVWLYENALSRKGILAKATVPVILLIIICLNVYGTRQREEIWDIAAKEIRDCLYNMKGSRPHITDGSVVVLINFPMSTALSEPMLKVYYNLEKVTVIRPNYFPTKLSEVLYIRGDVLLVRGKTGIYDLSNDFNKLLAVATDYQRYKDTEESVRYREEYNELAMSLNQIVLRLMAKT